MFHSPDGKQPTTNISSKTENNEQVRQTTGGGQTTTDDSQGGRDSLSSVSEISLSKLRLKVSAIRATLSAELSSAHEMLETEEDEEVRERQADILKEVITSLHKDLVKCDEKLENVEHDWTEKEMNDMIMLRVQTDKEVKEVLWRLNRELLDSSVAEKPINNGNQASSSAFSTPQVIKVKYEKPDTVPRFSGDVKQFRAWYELFDKYVDKNDEMMVIEKYKMLRDSLVGRAASEIIHLRFEESQYTVALEAIKSKFGGESGAEEAHLKEIRRICSSDLRRPNKLGDAVSAIVLNTKALVALGRSYEALSLAITPLILEGIPFSLGKMFSKWYKSTQTAQNMTKLQALLEFLEEDCAASEEISNAKATSGNVHHKSNTQHQTHRQTFKSRYEQQERNVKQGYAFQATAQKIDKCIFCEGSHLSQKCKKPLSIDQRKEILLKEEACFRCLQKNHVARKCRSRQANCPVCNRRHFAIMCEKKGVESGSSKLDKQANQSQGLSATSSSKRSTDDVATVLQTGYVQAKVGEVQKVVRILLDSGSQKSYVSSDLVRALNSKPIRHQSMVVYGIGGKVANVERMPVHRIEMRSRFDRNKSIFIECLEMNQITKGELPHINSTQGYTQIADKIAGNYSSTIEVLLGSDSLPRVLTGKEVVKDNIVASGTIFGWFFMGHDEAAKNERRASTLCAFQAYSSYQSTVEIEETLDSDKMSEDISFLWEVEHLGIENPTTSQSETKDKEVEEHFRRTVKRLSDGRYMVSLPFKDNISALGDNMKITRQRLQRFLASNKENVELLKAIDTEMQKFIDKGYIELAEPRKEGDLVHYLPIQAVVKSTSSSTKVRIVKDGSCRSKGAAALNDVLHQGTCLVPDLLESLMFFRKYKIAIVADIEKAFLQFKVEPAHRTFLRFFWPLNISENKNAPWIEFWSTTLDFGLVCSTFLHIAGIRYHLEKEAFKCPNQKDFLEEIASHFYIDDIITGADSVQEAQSRVAILLQIFESGKFPLKKWASNSKALGKLLSTKPELKDAKVEFENVSFKFLGICWNQQTDEIKVFADNAIQELTSKTPSKRVLLKGLSQIFDPYGLAAPIVLKAKMLLQKLWVEKVDWDDRLSETHLKAFECTVNSFTEISKLSISRKLNEIAARTELHIFSDASLQAYGSVAYIRYVFDKGNAKTVFVLARSRVAPTKGNWNIHRLELLGAVLAVRLANKIKKVVHIAFDSVTFWTDNAAVLGWVKDSPSRWKVFVANRVKEIHASSQPSQWQYVGSEHNVADFASRASLLERDENIMLWLNGPSWLRTEGQPGYSISDHKTAKEQAQWHIESKTLALATVASQPAQVVDNLVDVSRFSSWKKLVRTTAFVLRFIARCRRNKPKSLTLLTHAQVSEQAKTACITASEFDEARLVLLSNVQRRYYSDELKLKCTNISKDSTIYQYRPFLDEKGFIRCKSRLENSSELGYEEKFPLLVPADDPLIKLLIFWTHTDNCLHTGGVAETLHHLRRSYLVLGARKVVKSTINKCNVCLRFKAKPAVEQCPPLPAFRIDRCAPFAFSACDFAGPLKVSNEAKTNSKAYIVLFTCTVTRAVHLELAVGLTTAEFLLSFRRFLNRRPTVQKIISDNGKTFHRAAKELKLIYQHIRSNEMQALLANAQITWEFITEYAPWQGGVWERLVQTVKRPLRKILGTNVVSARELATILTDIEAMVNRRPISRIELNPDEVKALSPADLLYGYQGRSMLPDTSRVAKVMEEASAEIFSRRWRRQQNILNAFWRRFKTEYLQFLRSAHTSFPVKPRPLSEGDICILENSAPSRAYWPLCRVMSLSGGERTDLRKRSCLVKLATGQILRRPIQLLYPLEVQ